MRRNSTWQGPIWIPLRYSRIRMLRIQKSANGEVLFTLSGEMDEESIVELESVINSAAKGCRIVLDLKDVTLANDDAITFLVRCEANSITLKNCPAYVLEWISAKREIGSNRTI